MILLDKLDSAHLRARLHQCKNNSGTKVAELVVHYGTNHSISPLKAERPPDRLTPAFPARLPLRSSDLAGMPTTTGATWKPFRPAPPLARSIRLKRERERRRSEG